MTKAKKTEMRKYIFAMTCMALIMAMASCKKTQEAKPEDLQSTKFENAMTEKDTLAVKELIDKFFRFAIAKDYDGAASMLYRNDLERNGKAWPLIDEEKEKVKKTLQVFPPMDYSIEYIKFNKYKENEVLCNVIMSKTEDGKPLATTKMFFKPVNNMGIWYLCLMDKKHGDRGVVKPEKRDSVRKAYKAKEAQKAAAKAANQ